MSFALTTYRKLSKWPMGKRIFSRLLTVKAPYFATIRPVITELKPGFCEARIKDRRSVHNHIGTVHAIAMCNMAELVAGLSIDSAIPRDLRWIPKKMTVEYVKKAKGDLTGAAHFDTALLSEGDILIPVDVKDPSKDTVFRADITMYVSRKK